MKWLIRTAVTFGLLWLLWKLQGALLTPVPLGRNLRLCLVLRVTGPAPELEAAVRGLAWLLEDGTLSGSVMIVDRGMDDQTREIARHLASGVRKVTLWTKESNAAPSP